DKSLSKNDRQLSPASTVTAVRTSQLLGTQKFQNIPGWGFGGGLRPPPNPHPGEGWRGPGTLWVPPPHLPRDDLDFPDPLIIGGTGEPTLLSWPVEARSKYEGGPCASLFDRRCARPFTPSTRPGRSRPSRPALFPGNPPMH